VLDMGNASDALMQLRPVTFRDKPAYDDGSNVAAMLLEQVQQQHATMAKQAARLESQAGQLAQQKVEIAAQQQRLDGLGRQQAKIDALRQQLERLTEAVSARQGSAASHP
jgi:hypothetical protein